MHITWHMQTCICMIGVLNTVTNRIKWNPRENGFIKGYSDITHRGALLIISSKQRSMM